MYECCTLHKQHVKIVTFIDGVSGVLVSRFVERAFKTKKHSRLSIVAVKHNSK